MTRALLLLLALMCENVNAAPQDIARVPTIQLSDVPAVAASVPSREWTSGAERATTSSGVGASQPFTIAHPLCQTGFTIAMRYDERNAAGAIIKSVWVRKCVRVPRIVYGRKV